MINAYKDEENKRKEMEFNIKRQELEPPERKRRSSSRKNKNIHIIAKPCNHVIEKNSKEVIVRQVNEVPNDEVGCSPIPRPLSQPVQPINHVQQAPPPPQQILNLQQHYQTQYVLVPVEMLRNKKIRRTRSTDVDPDTPTPQLIQQPQKLIVESVSTQTSDRSLNAGSELQKKTSEDWLSGFDDRDGERIDLDEETDEVDSDKVMKRRREFEEKKSCKRGNDHEQASSETRVSIESDAPPNPAPPPSTTPETSSTTPSTVTSSTSDPNAPTASDAASGTGTGTESSDTPASSAPPTSAASGPPAPKSNDKDSTGDKIYVKSEYCGAPGEKVTTISSNVSSQQPKSKAPAPRPSIFPYFVEPKAPSSDVSTSKASSKMTNPDPGNSGSSFALYREKQKKMATDSAKVYNGPTKKEKDPK
ncbi:Flocculation protein FLO11-like [Caenorhabditis elegans]|nr:Flocculation protein FLO11-like [Caenorhabditis elegans]CTQ86369.1 Flocculation protein FLO11-like [Caenorhabditis elegans]|eukprot:NP_001300430.1 Uncharacterized protein CELE_M05B5.3 [Caenorhabditis elegans]